jgi:hypothetical protein
MLEGEVPALPKILQAVRQEPDPPIGGDNYAPTCGMVEVGRYRDWVVHHSSCGGSLGLSPSFRQQSTSASHLT